MLLETERIWKSYGRAPVLHDVSLGVQAGNIVCLLGPSGCGKSTLLRVIAGLEQDYTGTVLFNGRAIDRVPVHERGFGLMFQDFALLPHRRVDENIAFGLRMQRLPRPEIERRINEMLELVGLPGYGRRTIFELSGGERQRVALARSIAPRPQLLMLDEPLGALDRTLRERLTGELRQIIKGIGLTSVYVTHDQAEAFAVADRVVLMDRGRIMQQGTPLEVYRQPTSAFAAKFMGLNNLIEIQAAPPRQDPRGRAIVETALGPLVIASTPSSQTGDILLIRPEAAVQSGPNAVNIISGRVVRTTFRGSTQRIVLNHTSGIELELDVEAGSVPEDGELQLALRSDQLTLIHAHIEP